MDMVTMTLLTKTANTRTSMTPKTESTIKTTNMIENTDGVSKMLVRLLLNTIQILILKHHITTTISIDGAQITGTE